MAQSANEETVTHGDYTLRRWVDGQGGKHGELFRNGEKIGHYWPDKYDDKLSVFRAGDSRAVARLKTEAGCVRNLTNGEWNGKTR